jgi:hypothetical protein
MTAATSRCGCERQSAAAPELLLLPTWDPVQQLHMNLLQPAATAATSGVPAVQQSSRQAKQVFSDAYFPARGCPVRRSRQTVSGCAYADH